MLLRAIQKTKYNFSESCLKDLFSVFCKWQLESSFSIIILTVIIIIIFSLKNHWYKNSFLWCRLNYVFLISDILVFQIISEIFEILISFEQPYGHKNQFTVLIGCIKTIQMALVSSMFQVYCTRKLLKSFRFLVSFFFNKMTILISKHQKVVC